jgi:uncharacterized protein
VDRIDYPALVRHALVGVVRAALGIAAEGLPGEHHLYLGFRTSHPGVEVPPALRGRFPGEMTIVLQHQYWNLQVEDEWFAVTLRFGGVPQRLKIPFEALTTFSDPAGPFAIRLDASEAPPAEGPAQDAAADPPEPGPEPETVPAGPPPSGKLVDLNAFRKNR